MKITMLLFPYPIFQVMLQQVRQYSYLTAQWQTWNSAMSARVICKIFLPIVAVRNECFC